MQSLHTWENQIGWNLRYLLCGYNLDNTFLKGSYLVMGEWFPHSTRKEVIETMEEAVTQQKPGTDLPSLSHKYKYVSKIITALWHSDLVTSLDDCLDYNAQWQFIIIFFTKQCKKETMQCTCRSWNSFCTILYRCTNHIEHCYATVWWIRKHAQTALPTWSGRFWRSMLFVWNSKRYQFQAHSNVGWSRLNRGRNTWKDFLLCLPTQSLTGPHEWREDLIN